MMDDDIELDDETPPFEPDPRIRELVEYAVSGVELILNAEFLLDEWVTACLRRNAMTALIYRRHYMTPAEKFILAAEESGFDMGEEYGDRETYGFLLDIYRLRGMAARLSDEDLTWSIVKAYSRHWGEQAMKDCYLPLSSARQMIAQHLVYAEIWFSFCDEPTIPYLDEADPSKIPAGSPMMAAAVTSSATDPGPSSEDPPAHMYVGLPQPTSRSPSPPHCHPNLRSRSPRKTRTHTYTRAFRHLLAFLLP